MTEQIDRSNAGADMDAEGDNAHTVEVLLHSLQAKDADGADIMPARKRGDPITDLPPDLITEGQTVILDGTWTDPEYRERARRLATDTATPMVELACAAPLDATVNRIRSRTDTTSQVTPEIATALADHAGGPRDGWPGAHRIDTTREPAESVAEALDICRTAC